MKLPAGITSRASRVGLKAKQHSPEILFAAGLVSMGATVVTACRATLKAEPILEEMIAQKERIHAGIADKTLPAYTEEVAKKDVRINQVQGAVKLAKLYAVPTGLGILSVVLLTTSHKILKDRNAALSAAYLAASKALEQYRARVVDELGEDKDREFMYGKASEIVTTEDENGKKKTKTVNRAEGTSMYARMFTQDNPNYDMHHDYNVMFLRGLQQQMNNQLQAKGHVFLNEVYDELGMERSPAGQVVGWVKNNPQGNGYIDFGIFSDSSLSRVHDYLMNNEGEILVDFNVDGEVWKLI
jgi:hypothetical protein